MNFDLSWDSYPPSSCLPVTPWAVLTKTVTSQWPGSEHFCIFHSSFDFWMIIAHSNPVTFLVSQKHTFGSSSLSIYLSLPTNYFFKL